MTKYNAIINQQAQSQPARTRDGNPVNFATGTVIWSAESVPVAEIARHLHKRKINWFAQEDGSRTDVPELTSQFFRPMNWQR